MYFYAAEGGEQIYVVAVIASAVAGLPVLLVCRRRCRRYAGGKYDIMVYMCHVAWLLGVRGLVFVIRGRQRRGRLVPETNGPTGTGCDPLRTGASAAGGLLLRGRVYPRERSAALGAFYAELRKWVLKEDEAAVAELMGVSPGHVAEVLAGRKPGYGVLCLLVEYASENRAAGRRRVVRSAARRAEQVEELRLDFMAAGCDRGAMGASADKLPSSGDAMNRVSTAKAQDVKDGIIDFNGMEG